MKLILSDNQPLQHKIGKTKFGDSKIRKVGQMIQKSLLCRFLICQFKRWDLLDKIVQSYMFVQEPGNRKTPAAYRQQLFSFDRTFYLLNTLGKKSPKSNKQKAIYHLDLSVFTCSITFFSLFPISQSTTAQRQHRLPPQFFCIQKHHI